MSAPLTAALATLAVAAAATTVFGGAATAALAGAVGATVAIASVTAARSRFPVWWNVGIVVAAALTAVVVAATGSPDGAAGIATLLGEGLGHLRDGTAADGGAEVAAVAVGAMALIGHGLGWTAATSSPRAAAAVALVPALAVGLAAGTDLHPGAVAVFGALVAGALAASSEPTEDASSARRRVAAASVSSVLIGGLLFAVAQTDTLLPAPSATAQPQVPPQGGAAADGDEAVTTGDEAVAVVLHAPVRRTPPVLLFQRVRSAVLVVAPFALLATLAVLSGPPVRRWWRRTWRRRRAEAEGPTARIVLAYREWREACLDLGIGSMAATPLEFLQAVEPDPAHEQLAWLVTRTVHGDLRGRVGDAEATAAEDLSRSLQRRVRRAADPADRLVAFLRPASLRPAAVVPGPTTQAKSAAGETAAGPRQLVGGRR